MKKLYADLKKGEIKVQIENLDDLWYLSTVIEPNDLIKGKTIRKIKIGDEGDRKQNIIKKPIFLEIQAEKIEFSKTSDILRISGKIKQGPEDIKLDSYHTFNVEENTTITITKKWLSYQLDKIKEACSDSGSKILIVVHDREEAYFAIMKKYGYEELCHIQGNVQKKADMEKISGNFYAEVIKKILDYDTKHKFSQIIVASTAFWKEELMKNLKDENVKKRIVLATCSSVDRSGIVEVLKRPETVKALQNERISKELKSVEKLLNEISKDNLGCYGLKETEDAVNAGAVSELLITDKLIMKSREDGDYEKIDNILKNVDKAKGSILIISSLHDGGKKLDGLGGIGGILRYKVNY